MKRAFVVVRWLCGAGLLVACDAEPKASADKAAPPDAAAEPAADEPAAAEQPATAEAEPPARDEIREDATTAPIGEAKGQRYEVESGFVEYTLSGSRSGTEKLYFADFGARESRHTQSQSADPTRPSPATNALTIIDGETLHQIDLGSKTGTTLPGAMAGGGLGAPPGGSLVALGKAVTERLGGEAKGTKVVAGTECDVVEVPSMNAEVCMAKGVPLSVTIEGKEMSESQVATRVGLGEPVAPEYLAVPPGVTMRKVDLGNMFKPPAGAPPMEPPPRPPQPR